MPLAAGGGLRHDHVMRGAGPWWPGRQAVAGLMAALATAGGLAVGGNAASAAYCPAVPVLAVGLAFSFARCCLAAGSRFAGLAPRPRAGNRRAVWHVALAG